VVQAAFVHVAANILATEYFPSIGVDQVNVISQQAWQAQQHIASEPSHAANERFTS
jgi:hypothetical protein